MLRLALTVISLSWGSAYAAPTPAAPIPSPPQLSAKSWVLMDAASGEIITSEDPDERLPPASLTKLMTVYIATREIQDGRLRPSDMVTVSENAWRTEGSRMFLDPKSKVSIQNLMKGVVIDSGNDASVAIAEHIAGSEESFAGLMNITANRLGLKNTHFENPTGLPSSQHYSSALDMAKLARTIITDESAYYSLYKQKYFSWNGIRQPNRNLLLWRDKTVDGLKTGHTEAAGYCMVTSAKRDGRRLITAVFGSNSMKNRANDAQKLLAYGFRYFDTETYAKAIEVLANPIIWKGENNSMPVGLLDDVTLTLPKNQNRKVERSIVFDEPLIAPVKKGDVVGTITFKDGEHELVTRPLIALRDEAAGSWLTRTWDTMRLFFRGIFQGAFSDDSITS
ncbi:D-alanyl-D-alanine carboxypeptidase [Pseudomonas sp. V1]|nr:D-alanyl-D-alanine carboxypeptidase [Pseudomonas arcuscaelestis]